MHNKLSSYFGFCVRSGKIVYGVDDIDKQKKSVFLIVYDGALGESSTRTLMKAQQRLGCPLVVASDGALAELLHKPAVKAVAIKEQNLAKAILSVLEEEPSLTRIELGRLS